MKFKPFSKKYNFKSEVLIKKFPRYLYNPIGNWLWKVLNSANVAATNDSAFQHSHRRYLKTEFVNRLQIFFREEFPLYWNESLTFILESPDRTSNFLALCLQNFADSKDANELEYILSQGGSGFEVVKTDKSASDYQRGMYDLMERVNPLIKKQAQTIIDSDKLIYEAWNYCYSRNPDYEKVVSRCSDFLENFIGKIYFPKDPKPQLKKFVYAFETKPTILNYKGSSIVSPKNTLTNLLKNASDIRGQHTKGKGRKPTKEEAEFVLHTTIYIWNLHQTKIL